MTNARTTDADAADSGRRDVHEAGGGGSRRERRRAVLALALLVPAPSLGVWVAMWIAPGNALAQALFAVSKVWLLVLPAVWERCVDGGALGLPRPRGAGLGVATLTGLLFVAAVAGAYAAVGAGWIDERMFRERLREVGFDTPLLYVSLAVYWCAVNSLLEEYVWRWFVLRRCARLWSPRAAVVAAGFLFTVHHLIALKVYFDWVPALLAALGVWIGGATWSWIYLRSQNIWAAWWSHVLADIPIFVIGYRVLFGSL